MQTQRTRQLARYKSHRPTDTEEYKQGAEAACISARNGITIDCPHHLDSGRAMRWCMGYTDELVYITHQLYLSKGQPARFKTRCSSITQIKEFPRWLARIRGLVDQ